MTTPLPPTDPSTTDDNLPDETELVALYRQLPRNEPAPALDAAVLRAAAQALDSTGHQVGNHRREAAPESGGQLHAKASSAIASIDSSTHARRRRVPRWLIGLGSAASLVLVAGLAWHMRGMPAQVAKSAPASENQDAAQAMTSPNSPEKPLASPAEPSALAASPREPAAPAAPPLRANHLPPLALPGLKPIAPGASRSTVAPYKLSDKVMQQDNAAAMNTTRQAVLENRAGSAPKQPEKAQDSEVMAVPSAVMEVAAPAPGVISSPDESATAVNHDDTPGQELEKIRQLAQQKHEVEARQRLQAFHRAYPQWSIPADLRGLLDEP